MAEDNAPQLDAKPTKASRSFSERAERSLKEADRMLKRDPDRPGTEQAMAQLEQAKVWALLYLADAIRDSRTG